MATGYVAAAGDLDLLFQARTSAAGSNTGYKSNGGVDLAQRFEPRGGTTAGATTGFQSAGVDLATIFKATIVGIGTITAGTFGTQIGWHDDSIGTTPFGSRTGNPAVSGATNQYHVAGITYTPDANIVMVQLKDASGVMRPPNADTSWSTLQVTGVFADSSGATVTRTLTRSAYTGVGPFSVWGTSWNFPLSSLQMIAANVYSYVFAHT